MQGVLYLVPNTLGNHDTRQTIPPAIPLLVKSLKVFIVENLRNARRYLKSLDRDIDIAQLVFHELNEHTQEEDVPGFLSEVLGGQDAAVITEAGVPGVADPGAQVVRMAHQKGIRVIPMTGPSSILLSLMASGLNGQSFRFRGYLPIKRPERIRMIRELEQVVNRHGETQIFIETPYRNDGLLADIIASCKPSTMLCVAADISTDSEFIRTQSIDAWKNQKPSLHKRPAVFLMGR